MINRKRSMPCGCSLRWNLRRSFTSKDVNKPWSPKKRKFSRVIRRHMLITNNSWKVPLMRNTKRPRMFVDDPWMPRSLLISPYALWINTFWCNRLRTAEFHRRLLNTIMSWKPDYTCRLFPSFSFTSKSLVDYIVHCKPFKLLYDSQENYQYSFVYLYDRIGEWNKSIKGQPSTTCSKPRRISVTPRKQ